MGVPLAANNLILPQIANPDDVKARYAVQKEQQAQIAERQRIRKQQQAAQKLIADAGGDVKKALPAIMQVAPEIGMEYQKKIADWDKLDVDKKIKELELAGKKMERLGQLAGAVKDEQTKQMALQTAVAEGLIDQQTAQQIAQQPFDPRVFQQFQMQAMSAKDQAAQQLERTKAEEAARHNKAMENAPTSTEKDFQAWYKAKLEAGGLKPNARIEMAARDEYRKMQKERVAVPGVDVPFPDAVVKQKKDIAAAGKSTPSDKADELLTPTEAGTLGVPYGTTRKEAFGKDARTTEERNKERNRSVVSTAVQAVRDLGEKVITEKVAIVQRAKAAGRAVDAALADDPEYRAYQDSRVALAGNLAVLQQGSRPSDADIKAVWLPLVPDAFRDTANSAALKWKLIDQMSGFDSKPQGEGPAVGTVQDGYRFKGGNPADRNNWEKQ